MTDTTTANEVPATFLSLACNETCNAIELAHQSPMSMPLQPPSAVSVSTTICYDWKPFWSALEQQASFLTLCTCQISCTLSPLWRQMHLQVLRTLNNRDTNTIRRGHDYLSHNSLGALRWEIQYHHKHNEYTKKKPRVSMINILGSWKAAKEGWKKNIEKVRGRLWTRTW